MKAPRSSKVSLWAIAAVATATVVVAGTALLVTGPPSPASQPSPPPPAQPPAPEVQITNFSYVPGNLTVKAGTTVNWTNLDPVGHTVTVGGHGGGHTGSIDSGLLAQNQSFSYTFDAVGTFAYHCDPHPNMTANITVTA